MWSIFFVQIILHLLVLIVQTKLLSKQVGNYEGLSLAEIRVEGNRVQDAIDRIGRYTFSAQIILGVIFVVIQLYLR